MDYKVQSLWPTKILLADNFIDNNYIETLKTEILNQYIPTVKNWQSNSTLFEHKEFTTLANKINSLCIDYLKEVHKQVFEELKITSMWANVLKTGEFHRPHTHSNNVLSGVFYIQANDRKSAEICFSDPRPQAGVFSTSLTEYNPDNSEVWSYPSITNRLLIFPAWLNHYVKTNDTKEDRISISFNLMYKGVVGNLNELQSNIF